MAEYPRTPVLIRDDATLLMETARAATNPVDLRSLVERFATVTLEAAGSWRATVFLLDGDSLVLWANQSRETSEDTRIRNWERGLELGDIDLAEVPARKELFEIGLPIAIPDARASELVPDSWVETFGLGALVVAPLVAGGEPLGLLVADWPDRHDIGDDVVEMLGAIAGTLALAVQNSLLSQREAERADALRALLEATTVLRSSADLEELADRLVEPVANALGADSVSICLLEDGGPRFRTLASCDPFIPRRGSLHDLARPLQKRMSEAWREHPEPLVVSAEESGRPTSTPRPGPSVALPLVGADHHLLGFVLAGLREYEPAARAVELAGALTSHLAAAVDRTRLQEMLALETERLRGLRALWGFD
ncbi:MAG TPA: GAF domain-containing protein, partial [Acidimicrobiia bacterium]|nr:GAF domain-containing protein [Acidimicrobiia bacterium]